MAPGVLASQGHGRHHQVGRYGHLLHSGLQSVLSKNPTRIDSCNNHGSTPTMPEGTHRRLATIVAADIVGFSRLVGPEEEATLAAQRGHRSELIEPLLAEHHGRLANKAGDSFLFEFPSPVEAVRCLIAIQDGMIARNQDVLSEQRTEHRIGVNVGDVVADGDDLLGDGINITARLENLCEPGGLALSDDAYRQVRDRLDVG